MENLFIYIVLFVFGSVFGSFGSVLLRRLRGNIDKNTIKGIILGRSKCPSCENVLGCKDLVPFFSYLFNKGKCRFCGNKISLFYPFLELFSGFSFILSFVFVNSYFGFVDFGNLEFLMTFLFMLILNRGLVLLFFADFLFYELNLQIWLFLVLLTIFFQFFGILGDFEIAFLGGVIFFAIFYFIYIFSKFYVRFRFGMKDTEGFGGGDVMLAFLIGLLIHFVLSFNGLEFSELYIISFYYIMLSSLFGILLYFFVYLFSKGKHGQAIPFLPAMILAFWIILFYSDVLVKFFNNF